VEAIASAALKDLTGKEYITSNSHTLLHTYESNDSDVKSGQKDEIKDEISEDQRNSIKSK
jgi:hypothetical protein